MTALILTLKANDGAGTIEMTNLCKEEWNGLLLLIL
tara:strand:- start:550 stop:657 length:108 start_codon:yes stop_codon:yes gene_type:complete